MKQLTLTLCMCCAIQMTVAGEIQLKSGGKITGDVVSVIPATVTIKTATGTIMMPVADLGLETIRTLPASVSAPYVRCADLKAKFAENALDLALIQDKVDKVQKEFTNAMVNCYVAGKEEATRKKTGGVPADVDDRIRAKVEAMFPGDFFMQKHCIDVERNAWLDLHNR